MTLATLLLAALAQMDPPVYLQPPTALKAAEVDMDSTSIRLDWRDGGVWEAPNPPRALAKLDIAWSTTPFPTDPETDTDAWFDAAEHLPNPPTPGDMGSPNSALITGLSPGFLYYVAIRGSIAGDGYWLWVDRYSDSEDPDVAFASGSTAADGGAPAAITDLGVVALDSSAVTLAWTASGDDGNHGRARSYELRTSTRSPDEFDSPAAWFADADAVASVPVPGIGDNAPLRGEHATIAGLELTRHYAAIRAVDETGLKGPVLNTASFVVPVGAAGSETATRCHGFTAGGAPACFLAALCGACLLSRLR